MPLIASLPYYLKQGCFPGGTTRNWASYGSKIGAVTDEQKYMLADPQTSGGLLVAVSEETSSAFEKTMQEEGCPVQPIGKFKPMDHGPLITVA